MEQQPLIIQLDTPFCNLEEFERRTGIDKDCARKAIEKGIIPIMPKKKGERTLVNLVKWFQYAASQPY
ncbi:MAG: hypothetical protein KH943_08030 [Haemophilus parahaemolyticus]|uniref:hypothetical protein n=1 Tax=Haemophilus parahaemolyticus TaxID=735 RepID=UPI0026E9825F|nr:hypothetical protein [Haemophilus parahaemolyticus]MBS6009687.1 hypothetical protein [Haemophilus parahaemolyticus]